MAGSQLDWLRALVLKRRSQACKLLLTIAALMLATGIRWLLDRGANGVPFLTFYPVILLTALFLGGRYAVISAVVAVVVARFGFGQADWLVAEVPVRAGMAALFVLTVGIIVMTGHFVRLILLENQAHIAQAEAFNAELQHRAKNALQILRALIGRRPSPGEDLAMFQAKVLGRMEALSKANELLRFGSLETVSLGDLVATATAPFDRQRFHYTGPAVAVHKSAATALVMALHELATNGLKYGALSADEGRVDISWSADGDGHVHLRWQERGGPPVSEPETRGFGSRLLRPHGGMRSVELDWDPAGLVCRIVAVCRAEAEPAETPRSAGDGKRFRPGYTAP